MSTEPISEAQAFYHFLGERLKVGGQEESIDQLLEVWRKQQEYRQTVAAVQEGLRDAEAGRMRPLRELLNDLRSDSSGQSQES